MSHFNHGPHIQIVPQLHGKSKKIPRLETANIVSWNVNSLSKNDSATWLFGTMDGYRPNIICFQETLLNKVDSDLFEISGFTIFPSPATSSKPKVGEKRGLIIAVSKDFVSEWAPISDRLSMGNGIETQSVRVYGSEGHLTVHNVYVHHESSPSSISLDLPDGKHVIAGDFNARHEEWEPNESDKIFSPRGKSLHHLILNAKHLVLVNQPKVATTIHGTTPSLVLVSAELAASTDWQVLEGSPAMPHMPTITSIQFESPTTYPAFKPHFLYRNADWEKLECLTEREVSHPNLSIMLETRLTWFVDKSLTSASEAIPKTKCHDKVAPWDCWWFTHECKLAKSRLHKAVKSFMNKTTSRAELRNIRSETIDVYTKAKSEEWNKICQDIDLKTSLSSQWRRLRWLYNGGQSPKQTLLLDPQTRANESISFFAERTKLSNLNYVAKRLQEELQAKRENVINEAIRTSDIFDTPYSRQELDEALYPVKNSKPGNDDISFLILSHLGNGMKNELLAIINQSWDLQRLPGQWKLVPIIPIPKKEPGEYRPIALLSCICKVMERMVLCRLKYKVGPFHHGLVGGVSGRGTTDAIATVAKLAADARHNRSGPTTNNLRHCYALFIDFEKAFELANSGAILQILASEKGVNGNMLAWLKDYLSDRKGYTIVQGVESDPIHLENGTPQGSVLSPFLFNVLIDKLLQTIESELGPVAFPKVTVIAYADDIALVSNHAFGPALMNKAAYALEIVSNILGLKINVSKTKAMAWNHSHFLPDFCFKIYNNPVEWVRQFKYLGVIFDDQLSFTQHSKYIAKSAQKRINILKHMAGSPYGATQSTLMSYVKTCIRPILEYGNIVHPIARASAIKTLETLHNVALRIALRVPKHTPNVLVRAEAGVTSLNTRALSLATVAYSKIKAQMPNHPFFHQNKEMHMNLWMFQKNKKRENDLPLDIALEKVMTKFGSPVLQSIDIPTSSPLDPTLSSFIRFNISPLPKPKEAYLPAELVTLREEIYNIIETLYEEEDQVYVDGSVDMESGRAASAYIFKTGGNPVMETFRITDWVSSTQAELGAIFKVLENILVSKINHRVVIFCDSMSALQTLQCKPNPLDSLTYDILRLSHFLIVNRKISISMHWIPSHIGIEYNEKVDDWAKQGTLKDIIDFVVPSTVGQVKSTIKRYIKQTTLEELNSIISSPVANPNVRTLPALVTRYLQVNPKLSPQSQLSPSPRVQRDINRLRLGVDSWCYAHLTYMVCNYCKLRFTPEHYLCTCPVTSSHIFLQCLTPEEHSLDYKDMAPIILHKLCKEQYIKPLSNALVKYPISIKCENRNHRKIDYDFIKIPSGM